jgi:hypothetical protein
MWAAVAGAAVSVAGGMLSGSKARKAQKQQDLRKQEAADAMFRENERYSGQQLGMANEYQNYAMQPGMIQDGYGQAQIDPSTGQMRFNLNSQYQGLKDQMLGGANKAYALAGDFDPKTHAAERYASAQALLAPGDAKAESGLMMDLYNKGGFGLNTNKQTVGGGTTSVNPYVGTFMDARNTRDAGMSYNSLREGEQYLDNLINRGHGFTRGGMEIDNAGRQSMGNAMQYRQQFNNDYRNMLGMRAAGYNTYHQGVAGKYNAWAGGDPGFGANNQSQQWAAGGNALGGMIGGMDFSKMFGGSQQYSPNTMAQHGSGYYGGAGTAL